MEKSGVKYPNEVITLSCHYDTLNFDLKTLDILVDQKMPGADNNASGCITALLVAKILSSIEINRSIEIVFWDYEELGFLGSYDYLMKRKSEFKNKKKFLGLVNLLMLGNDTKRDDSEKKYGNMRAYIQKKNIPGHKIDLNLTNILLPYINSSNSYINFKLVENSFQSSGHIHFWKEGFPAVILTQNWETDFNNKRYHTVSDIPETLNIKTLYYNVKAIISGTYSLLSIEI